MIALRDDVLNKKSLHDKDIMWAHNLIKPA